MKTTLFFSGAVIATLVASAPAEAQYNARNLTRRINPQYGAPNQTRQPAQPARPPTPPTPPPEPAPAPTFAPGPAPVVRRAPPAPVDPEKERAAKEQTDRKALEFEMKRADEDFGWAQYALGMRYLTGNGVPQDDAQGRKWLEKSAKNGESRAVKELAKLEKEKGEPGESVGSTESHKDKGDAKPEEKSAPTSKSGDAGKK